MNDLDNLNTDLDETRKGLFAIIRENRHAAIGAGVLASIGATVVGPAGSAAGGAIGGLVGYAFDRLIMDNDGLESLDDEFIDTDDSADGDPDSERDA